MAKFATLAGYDVEHLYNVFKVKEGPHLLEIEKKAKTTKPAKTKNEVTETECKKVEQVVTKKYGGNVNEFCRANGLDQPTVRRIIARDVKLKSKLVKQVFAKVGLKI